MDTSQRTPVGTRWLVVLCWGAIYWQKPMS
jgi:hypothetical protein